MTTKKRLELFRDKKNGKIAGICAGIAKYFGWETWLVRVLAVTALLSGLGIVFILYIAAWLILDDQPKISSDRFNQQSNEHRSANESTGEDGSIKVKARVWQAGDPPKQAFQDIRIKFKMLEKRLIHLEHYVTSSEFSLSREINKL